jgi:hypothetical protein
MSKESYKAHLTRQRPTLRQLCKWLPMLRKTLIYHNQLLLMVVPASLCHRIVQLPIPVPQPLWAKKALRGPGVIWTLPAFVLLMSHKELLQTRQYLK